MPFQNKQKYFGFSLIEMLVTVGIISILIASVIGVYVWAPEKARHSKMVTEMEVFHKAAIRYHAKFSGWPRKLSDLNGLGVLRIPRDPWGGEYRLEEKYYITCRPPGGEVYRVPLCPKIMYNMLCGMNWEIIPVDIEEIKKTKEWKLKIPIETKVRLKLWPSGNVNEYRLFGDELDTGHITTVIHDRPDNLFFYGRPTDGVYDPVTSRVILDDEVLEYSTRADAKAIMCRSHYFRIYFYHFGNTDGDVDLDRLPEIKIAYEGDNMVVYDLDEDVDGVDWDFWEKQIQGYKSRGIIWWYPSEILFTWNPDYHCRWSVSH